MDSIACACGGKVIARGLCRRCYNAAYKAKAIPNLNRKRRPREEYFFEKVDTSGCCWEWTACTDRDGYGVFAIPGKKIMAHRWCWEFLVGSIPEGMVLDHLCMNKACVMPDHLEVVTVEENNRRYHALVGIGIYRGRG
jgi:hypothetical protein